MHVKLFDESVACCLMIGEVTIPSGQIKLSGLTVAAGGSDWTMRWSSCKTLLSDLLGFTKKQ